METVKFATRTQLRNTSQKELNKLWDKSEIFANYVRKEVYRREEIRINKALRELDNERKRI